MVLAVELCSPIGQASLREGLILGRYGPEASQIPACGVGLANDDERDALLGAQR